MGELSFILLCIASGGISFIVGYIYGILVSKKNVNKNLKSHGMYFIGEELFGIRKKYYKDDE